MGSISGFSHKVIYMVRFGTQQNEWVLYVLSSDSSGNMTDAKIIAAMNHTVTSLGWRRGNRISDTAVTVGVRHDWADSMMVEQLYSFGIRAKPASEVRKNPLVADTLAEIRSIDREEHNHARDEYRIKLDDPMVYVIMQGGRPIRAFKRRPDASAYIRKYGQAIAEMTVERIMLE